MSTGLPKVEILGVPVARLTAEEALAEVARLAAGPAPAVVAFANANALWLASRDPAYQAVLRRVALILNDGIGLSLAARMQGRAFPANLNGTDFTPRLLALAAERGWRVFLLGAAPGVAEKAAAALAASVPGLQIVGTHTGFIAPEGLPGVIAQIRSARTDLLIVGMGNPTQENWLDRNLAETGARLGVGVGAFIDFSAGVVTRAPGFVRRLRMEWLYRMFLEPRRLWRRYVVGGPVFLARAAWDARRRRRTPSASNPESPS